MNTPLRLNRRDFLKGAAGLAVFAAGGGLWRAYDQAAFSPASRPAYEHLTDAYISPAESLLPGLVKKAVLAANPHNTQPWLFHIGEGHIDLFADINRNIGSIDPYFREMHIGLGAALENIILSSQASGYIAQVTYQPDPAKAYHVARIVPDQTCPAVPPLYKAIRQRRTNRGPYDLTRPLADDMIPTLNNFCRRFPNIRFFGVTGSQRNQIGELIIQATQDIIADAVQSRDSARWLRLTQQEVDRYRDGITLDAQGLPEYLRILAKLAPPVSQEQSDRFWLEATRNNHTRTAAAYGIIAVADSLDCRQRLECGQVFQHMQLWATTQGLAMHPLCQIHERIDRERMLGRQPLALRNLQSVLGIQNDEWQPVFTFRLGYPTLAAHPSPRRSLQSVLI